MPGSTFIQDLGPQTLQAPVVTTFQMTAQTDTGIPGDQNTRMTQPVFIGQVFSSFPGTVANLQVLVEFNGLHPELGGGFDLNVGGGGRGFVGTFDVAVTTDNNGKFTVTAPPLPEGFQRAQIVVIGQADQPPLPGLSSAQEHAFRTDQTASDRHRQASLGEQLDHQPASKPPAQRRRHLVDPPAPSTYLATPLQVLFPAIDPTTASNVSNYSLTLTQPNGTTRDESQFITSATFVAGPPILDATSTYIVAYTGVINLTVATGLPAGNYTFTAHTAGGKYPGPRRRRGQPAGFVVQPSTSRIQSQPVFVTNLAMESSYSNDGSTAVGGPRSYYELPIDRPQLRRPRRGARPRRSSSTFPTPFPSPTAAAPINYSQAVQLIGSADTVGGTADGNFGTLGESGLGSTGTGFNIVPNTTVTLYNFNAATGQWLPVTAAGGSGTRLVLTIAAATPPAGRLLPALHAQPGQHRERWATDTRIFDIYGNQFDGEFLGNPTSTLSHRVPQPGSQPRVQFQGIMNYEDLLSSGTYRSGMSGDGVVGGAFTTGFVVVPTGNIVYARPDYVEDPLLSVHHSRRQPGQALLDPRA